MITWKIVPVLRTDDVLSAHQFSLNINILPRWHHRLGHEFGWTLGVGDGQGGLACCGPWGRRVGHSWVTELNWMTSPFSTQSCCIVMPDFLFSAYLISFKQFMPGLGYTGAFKFSFVWRCLASRTKPLTISLCSPQLDHNLLETTEQYVYHLFLFFSKFCSFKDHIMSS